MKRTSRAWASCGALVAAVMLLGACSGDDDSAGGDAAPAAADEAATTQAPTIAAEQDAGSYQDTTTTTQQAARTGSATVTIGSRTVTLPELQCEAQRDREGRTVGYYAVFGTLEDALVAGEQGHDVVVLDVTGYTGDGTYGASDGLTGIVPNESATQQGPLTELTVANGGHSGSFRASSMETQAEILGTFTCDPGDDTAATLGAPIRSTAGQALLTRRSGATIVYTGIRCGRGVEADGLLVSTGSFARDREAFGLETRDGYEHEATSDDATFNGRHLGIEIYASRRDHKTVLNTDPGRGGQVEFSYPGEQEPFLVLDWVCPR